MKVRVSPLTGPIFVEFTVVPAPKYFWDLTNKHIKTCFLQKSKIANMTDLSKVHPLEAICLNPN